MPESESLTAFAASERLVQGDRAQVALVVKTLVDARDPRSLLVFSDSTGEQVDFDLNGSPAEVLARLATTGPEPREAAPTRRGPGRPRLGVVGREVTLLPRHWEWLGAQPGGASVALRKLVERARSANQGQDEMRRAREATFRFVSAIAGNEPGFEEACRALFAGDRAAFATHTEAWPVDIRDFARMLAADAYGPE